MSKVLIVGGGAAGMFASIFAAKNGNEVHVFEKNEKLGKKLFITGKGRCNITNACDMEGLFDAVRTNAKFLYSSFYGYTNQQVIDFFERIGVPTKIERGDRVFPVSDHSSDVIRGLEREMDRLGVKVHLRTAVKKVVAKDGHFEKIILGDQRQIHADACIVATGGLSYQSTGSTGDGFRFAESLGHTVTDCMPALVPMECKEEWVPELQGLSLRNVNVTILDGKKKLYDDFGEMEFTKYGLDGPIIKSASCRMKDTSKENYKIVLDLKPALDEEKLDKRIIKDFTKYTNKNFENALDDLLPRKLIPIIIELSEIPKHMKVNQISKQQRLNLVHLLKNITFTVRRYRPIEEAIITSGGIKVSEINASTMESKIIKNLFFAGEIIDVDAYTGGFNLQIAYSTAYLAGINC